VLGATSTPAPQGGVLGATITTPNTGADAESPAATALLGAGLLFLLAGGLLSRRVRKES
jgi:hypothetical protein